MGNRRLPRIAQHDVFTPRFSSFILRKIDGDADTLGTFAGSSIRKRTGRERISLFGWATGGQWAGYYAALHSDKLSHIVIHNALYGANTPQPLVGHGSDLADPNHPGQFNPAVGAYRWNEAPSLLTGWDKSILIALIQFCRSSPK